MTSLSDHERSRTILSAEIGLAPPAQADVGIDQPHASVIGAATAAAICILIAAVGWQLAPEGWVVGIVGLPATTFLAWRMGPDVMASTTRGAINRATLLSVAAIVLTDALVVVASIGWIVVSSFASASNDGGASIISALGIGIVYGILAFFIGGVIFGVSVAVVVFPAALVWAAVVRRIGRRRP